MSCVVCRNENCAEIDRSHLMFDNLRNILNSDFTSIKISLQKIKGKGKIFIEDYIHCPLCYEKLPEAKTFIFLIKEAEMISEKTISLIFAKPLDYSPITPQEIKRIRKKVTRSLVEVANRFDGSCKMTIKIQAKGNA